MTLWFFSLAAQLPNQDVSGDETHLGATRTQNFVSCYTHFGPVLDTRRHIMPLCVYYTPKACIT